MAHSNLINEQPPASYWLAPEADKSSPTTAFSRLYDLRIADASRPFLARGHRIARCRRCQLVPCLCHLRCGHDLDLDVLLVLHRNEVLKPTNTGRLVADCFPANTYACTWHRTNITHQITDLLARDDLQPVLLYPGEYNLSSATPVNAANSRKKLLLIVLDGTWKQTRKMYLQSPWLHGFPALALSHLPQSDYGLRQAPNGQQLATAEAVYHALFRLGQDNSAQQLADYFQIFTQRYLAMRSNHFQQGQ